MFDALADKLQGVLGGLRKSGRLDEETIGKAMREIRLALLEADVNFKVVKEFVESVKARATGQDVLKSLTPGQQVVKIVHEELTTLMGRATPASPSAARPDGVLMVGLQGSGKTTACAQARPAPAQGRQEAALVPADLARPAAIDQLEQLGKQIQIPVYRSELRDPVAVARGASSAPAGRARRAHRRHRRPAPRSTRR